jgi:hypothetical protein
VSGEPAPASFDASTRLVAAREQVSAELDGEAVILSLADGVYYGLDGVGAFVWELLREPRTLAELCARVTAEFNVDTATAEHDLRDLLGELEKRSLVETAAAG